MSQPQETAAQNTPGEGTGQATPEHTGQDGYPNQPQAQGQVRIERLVTSGTFSLDGGTWDVDNNVWIVGDDAEVLVIDPAHDPEAVADQVGARFCDRVLLTHGHDDHIRYALETKDALGGIPVALNPADDMLWDAVFPDVRFDEPISEGAVFRVAGVTLRAIETPGHSPGSICFVIDAFPVEGLPADVRSQLGLQDPRAEVPVVISGDTLFQGGPGATGRSYSSFETIIESITGKLFELPDETVVLTGHGDATMIGLERPHLQEWLDRGH